MTCSQEALGLTWSAPHVQHPRDTQDAALPLPLVDHGLAGLAQFGRFPSLVALWFNMPQASL